MIDQPKTITITITITISRLDLVQLLDMVARVDIVVANAMACQYELNDDEKSFINNKK